MVMPGAPVRDLIARFREVHPGGPVLTCSGFVGEDLVRRGIEEGRYPLRRRPLRGILGSDPRRMNGP